MTAGNGAAQCSCPPSHQAHGWRDNPACAIHRPENRGNGVDVVERVTGGPVGGRIPQLQLRLTLQQAMAYHALLRNIAMLRGDATLLQDFGEKEIAKALVGVAALLEGATQKYLEDTQRTVIPVGGLVRP